MQYKDIETFLELVRTRNITRTAELMYISQSTVSNRLKSLEHEVGCQLIVRTRGHRRIQLTRQGEEFIPIATRWKELFGETEQLGKETLTSLRIASGESTYYTWIAPFITGFCQRHPEGKVTLQICDSDQVYSLVERNQIDFGFAGYESSRDDVEVRCIDTQPLCVLRYSPEPGPELVIHPSELDPSREIRFTGGRFDSMNAWHDRWFGPNRRSRLEVNTSRGMAPLMEGTDYWVISPIGMARELARKHSLQIYLLDEPPWTWQIFMLSHQALPSQRRQLCSRFKEELLDYIRKGRD